MVAAVSPFMAFLLGITPLPNILIVPGIALGNLVFTAVTDVLFRLLQKRKAPLLLRTVPSAVLGAGAKFLTMLLVQVKLILPLLGLPEAVLAAMSVKMGIEQLPTALIGGIAAALVMPLVKKAVKD